jgi:exopolysaccharide production protein ExoQ
VTYSPRLFHFLNKFEICFAVFAFEVFLGPFGDPPVIPVALISISRYSILILSILLCIPRLKRTVFVITRDIPLMLLNIMAMASFLWSTDFKYSQDGSRELLQMVSFAIYVAMRFSIRDQLRMMAYVFGASVLINTAFVVAIPSIGIHGADHPGSWKGLYDYKNTFGSFMAISTLIFWLEATDRDKPMKFWGFFWFAYSIFLVIMSTSKTALIVTFSVMFALFMYQKYRWKGRTTVIFLDLGILVLSSAIILTIQFWAPLLGLLGKDPTLTGRTPMWGVIISMIFSKPLLGWGRGGFWRGPGAVTAGEAVSMNYVPPHAHNGYLDIGLDTGVFGFLLFFVSLIYAFSRAFNRAYEGGRGSDSWPLGILMILFINNMTESYLMRLSNPFWVIYNMTALSLAIPSYERDREDESMYFRQVGVKTAPRLE